MAHRKRFSDDDLNHLAHLLTGIAGGDKSAFEQLHLKTRNKLRKTVLGICGKSSDTDDILQEAYVRVWRHAASYDPKVASPMTWMCIIARNLAIDAMRSQRLSLADLEEAMNVPAATEDDHFDYALAKRITTKAMRRLPEDRRRLLALAYFEGMSRQSLAQQFGVPASTIKTWLRRALINIQPECLAEASDIVAAPLAA